MTAPSSDPLAPITIKKVCGERVWHHAVPSCRQYLPAKHTHQPSLSRVSSDKTEANLKQELKDKQRLREAASQQGRPRSVQLTKTA